MAVKFPDMLTVNLQIFRIFCQNIVSFSEVLTINLQFSILLKFCQHFNAVNFSEISETNNFATNKFTNFRNFGLKFLKNVVAMAEIPKKGGCYG